MASRRHRDWTNGFEGNHGHTLVGCVGLENGQEGDNLWDAFAFSAGNGVVIGAMAISPSAKRHRYGFNDEQNNGANQMVYVGCRSSNHATATFNTQPFAGASVSTPMGPPRSITANSATPSVDNYGYFSLAYTSPTTVTNFLNGVSGQRIVVETNANVSIPSGSSIVTNGGTLGAGRHEFILANNVWRQIGGATGSGGSISNDQGDKSIAITRAEEDTIVYASPLTTGQSVTLAGNVARGVRRRIVRLPSCTGSNLNVNVFGNAIKTLAATSTGLFVDVQKTADSWIVTAAGTL